MDPIQTIIFSEITNIEQDSDLYYDRVRELVDIVIPFSRIKLPFKRNDKSYISIAKFSENHENWENGSRPYILDLLYIVHDMISNRNHEE